MARLPLPGSHDGQGCQASEKKGQAIFPPHRVPHNEADLDANLNRWRSAELPPRPPSGWIKAIRDGLGMAATHLASRPGVATSTVTWLETSEADDTISLATLRRAAEALGCELHYALVPKQSLTGTLETRALTLARQQMAAIGHTMALEAQATSREAIEAQTRALAETLLKGPRRALWKAPAPERPSS